MKKWTIEDSKELYNINGWGTSYFGINEKGDVYVQYCSASLISLTIGLRRHGAASRKQLKSMTTRVRIMWSIQSKSTRYNLWWKRLSPTARNSIWV